MDKVSEGTVLFSYPTLPKECSTWYKIYGDLQHSSTGRPLVILHGGPGACHNYMLPLADLAITHGIPVVFYDQLGNGNSTHIREKRLDEAFWTPELLLAEFENLLKHLGIADDYDLLGQSWGGMMGALWAMGGPQGLRRLIISNSPASMPLWIASCNRWRSQLPREVDEVLKKHERDKTYDNPEYKDAVAFYYKRHMCRVEPQPPFVLETDEWIEKDDTVYMTMNGPSEFTVVGSLKTWDLVSDLDKIDAPVLLLNGEFDGADDQAVLPFFRQIKKCRWYTFRGTSHMSHVEEPEKYNALVADFLKCVGA